MSSFKQEDGIVVSIRVAQIVTHCDGLIVILVGLRKKIIPHNN